MSDVELIQAVLAGDKERFGDLVSKYQGMVYGLAWHLLGNHADAQDVAQEVFLTAYSRLHQLLQPEKFAAWLRQITVNECHMWKRCQRKTASWESLPPAFSSPAASPEEVAERSELRQRVLRAIAALPDSQRLAVTLFYLDGLSYEEVGSFLAYLHPLGGCRAGSRRRWEHLTCERA